MMASKQSSAGWLERAVKWSVVGLMVYWVVYALVVPVTIWDSQTHDVARLLIAHHGGLFGNTGWNVPVQACFPWSFNAVEYPFLFLGFGYALPSFACFTGMLLIIYRLVREKCGEAAGWWCCLSMLALPTLVFQATSTKNDVAVVFGVFCWYYALRFWVAEKRTVFLGLMALALSFTAGAKSSGVVLAALLSAYTLWQIGWNQRAVFQYSLFLSGGLILLGSVEIYANNLLLYKSLLGPQDMVRSHVNNDGLRGALANAIRYFFGVMNVGVDVANHNSPFSGWMTNACREFLGLCGLNNAGYYSDYNDAKFYITKMLGLEAASDYGPVGALAIIYTLLVVLIRPAKDFMWKLAGAGLLSFGLICYTVGWQPWNNRFLLLPMAVFTLVFTLDIVRRGETALYRRAAKPLFILLLFSAVVFPLYSYNKGPWDLVLSLNDRDAMVAKERTDMLEIMKDIQALPGRAGPALVLLHPGDDSWILPILQIPLKVRGISVVPAPVVNPEILGIAKEKANGRRVYILALNNWIEPDAGRGLVMVKKYASPDSALLELQEPPVK